MKGNKVISVGFNSDKTHPVVSKVKGYHKDAKLHAEVDTLIGCKPNEVNGSTLYIVRLKRDNKWGLSKPCKGCSNYLSLMGIRKVIYSKEGGKYGALRLD